ncbi:MAG: HdeA/HdeB family chaperone [Methylococcales bacterium]|nr:HdeA/HdeB family chaperone [Methylococcales bacterium]
MNIKHVATGIAVAVMLTGSALVFAADAPKAEAPKAEAPKAEAPKADSPKKPLGKVTCEDFIAIDDVIKPQYVVSAIAHTKGGKAKNAVIEIVDTDTLVPFLVEECQKAPKESFWTKLKKKLHL